MNKKTSTIVQHLTTWAIQAFISHYLWALCPLSSFLTWGQYCKTLCYARPRMLLSQETLTWSWRRPAATTGSSERRLASSILRLRPNQLKMKTLQTSSSGVRLFGQGWFKPWLRPLCFLLQSSGCMMETCMLLTVVRVHEHWWPHWKPSGWEWSFIKNFILGIGIY